MRPIRRAQTPASRAQGGESTAGDRSLYRDGFWSLAFNLLNKTQTVAIVVTGALINGVVGVGEVATVVAGAAIGAGLADFGYSYECGRFVAAHPNRPASQRALARLPPLVVLGGVLSVLSFKLTIGTHAPWANWRTLAAIGLLGAALEASAVMIQILYSLDRFRVGSAILGLFRAISSPVVIALGVTTKSVTMVAVALAVTEIAGAASLLVATQKRILELPRDDSGARIGLAYLWLGLGSAANIFANRGDVLVVGALTSPLALGIYSVASQIENAIESVALVPSAAMLVHAARARERRTSILPLMRRGHRATLALSAASTIGVLLLYVGYLSLTSSHHGLAGHSAVLTIGICAASSSLVAAAGIEMTALLVLRKYRLATGVRLCSGLLAVALFVILVPRYGALGAAFGAAGRDASLLIVGFIATRRSISRVRSSPPSDPHATKQRATHSSQIQNSQRTVVFLSHTASGGTLRVGSHYLADQLAHRHNINVLHVATPISLLRHPRRRPGSNIETARLHGRNLIDPAGTRHLTPLLPLPVGYLPAPIDAALSTTLHRLIAREIPRSVDAVIVDQPLLWRVAALINTRQMIYRPTDLSLGSARRRAEAQLALTADAVITTCDPVLLSLPDRLRRVPHLRLVNGVDLFEFDAVTRPKERTGAIYIGAIDDRFDWTSVIAMAVAVPSARIDLYGPLLARVPSRLPANIALCGPITHNLVPRSLVTARVGLLPFSDHPWNAGRNPIKLFEYLAAGLNVVEGGLPHIASLQVPGLHSYQTPEDAGRVLGEVLGHPENRPGVTRAALEDWSIKSDLLVAFLDLLDSAS